MRLTSARSRLPACLGNSGPPEAFLRITDEFGGQADRALRCLEEGLEDATAVLVLPTISLGA